MEHKPSQPFANGTEFAVFNDIYCCNCHLYKLDEEGMPLESNCEIDNAMVNFQIGMGDWPANSIVEMNGRRVCLHFKKRLDNGGVAREEIDGQVGLFGEDDA